MFAGNTIQLTAFETDDRDALQEFLNLPALVRRRYLSGGFPDDAPLSRALVEKLIAGWQEQHNGFTLAVRHSATGELVGHCSADWGWDTLSPYLYVVIHPNHWRKGYGSETLHLIMDYLWNNLRGMQAAHSWVTALNAEGLAFAEQYGFKSCGTYRRAGKFHGQYYDSHMLDILREEWKGRE